MPTLALALFLVAGLTLAALALLFLPAAPAEPGDIPAGPADEAILLDQPGDAAAAEPPDRAAQEDVPPSH